LISKVFETSCNLQLKLEGSRKWIGQNVLWIAACSWPLLQIGFKKLGHIYGWLTQPFAGLLNTFQPL